MSLTYNWCFTLNNYTKEEKEFIIALDYDYLIYGIEVGKLNETEHLQGYIEFKSKKRFSTLQKLNERIHWEPRKGTQQQALVYCKKDGKFAELGVPKKQGDRTDLDTVRRYAIDMGMRGVTEQFNLQQIKIAEKYLTYNEPAKDWKPEVTWIWGKTGTGKSKLARELTTDAYTKSEGSKWWEGYDNHEHVIIDDFRDSWWSITEMLSLLDRYEKRVEYKGGYRQFRPRKIIITSCASPYQCYHNTGEAIDQLIRRIDEIRKL